MSKSTTSGSANTTIGLLLLKIYVSIHFAQYVYDPDLQGCLPQAEQGDDAPLGCPQISRREDAGCPRGCPAGFRRD